MNITTLPHPSSYIPGLVLQSVLAEKSIETQLEVSISTPSLKDNKPHLLLGYDKSKPDGKTITLRMRGEVSSIALNVPLPLSVSIILESLSILGDAAKALLAASVISGSNLYKDPDPLHTLNAKLNYGIDVSDRFLAFYATGDYSIPDSLFSTAIPFLPGLTGAGALDIIDFVEKLGIKRDTTLFDMTTEKGRVLLEEVLKKINSRAKRIVPSNTLVSFLPHMVVEKKKIDLRELATAIILLMEASPGSLLDALSRNTIYPILSEYYNLLESASELIIDIIEGRRLSFKTNLVITEDQHQGHGEVPIRYVSMALEFLGFIDKNHVFAIESDGVVISSKPELWAKQKMSKTMKATSVDHMHVIIE